MEESDNEEDFSYGPLPPSRKRSSHIQQARKHVKYFSRRNRALFCLGVSNPLRRTAKRIAKSRCFYLFVALVVVFHSLCLCLYKPVVNGDDNSGNSWIFYVTVCATSVYTLEALLKIVAYGLLLHPNAYLKRWQCLFDLFIISISALHCLFYLVWNDPLISEVLVSLMVLKLLTIISYFEEVNYVLKVLAKSSKHIFFLLLFMMVVVTFFALFGMELFSGKLHNGCYANYTTATEGWRQFRASEYPCSTTVPPPQGSHTCPSYSACLSEWDEGPINGVISFDNFIYATITVFQILTLEGWSYVFYLYYSVYGYHFVWIYFLSVSFFGFVFILNIFGAILSSVYHAVNDKDSSCKKRALNTEKQISHDFKKWLQEPKDEGHKEKSTMYRLKETRIWQSSSSILAKLLNKATFFTTGKARHVFFWFMIAVRAVNLAILMSLHYKCCPVASYLSLLDKFIYTTNYVFSLMYIVEFVLKLSARGSKYFKSYLRIFDFILTVVNVVDFPLLVYHSAFSYNRVNLTVIANSFRCIGLIRIFKCTRYWKEIRKMISVFTKVWVPLVSLTALLLLFLLVFTLLGVRLFGNRLSRDDMAFPNYDTFFNSFLNAFQLLTTEDWFVLFYKSVYVDRYYAIWIVSFFYSASVTFGGFFLLSGAFLAVAVDSFLNSEAEGDDGSEESDDKSTSEKTSPTHSRHSEHSDEVEAFGHTNVNKVEVFEHHCSLEELEIEVQLPSRTKWFIVFHFWSKLKEYIGTLVLNPKDELKRIPDHSSFFILDPENILRVFCYKAVSSSGSQVISYLVTVFSIILLAVELPIAPKSGTAWCNIQELIVYLDLVVIIYFLLESVLKMIALGLIVHKGSYFRGLVNLVDFIVTLTSLVAVVVYFARRSEDVPCISYGFSKAMCGIQWLRILRVFRLLRATRITGIYTTLSGLATAMKAVVTILLFSSLMITAFAITGTSLFRGRLYYCTDPSKNTRHECQGQFFTYPTSDLSCPMVETREWIKYEIDFDNFGASFLTLFVMITQEGWPWIMYSGVDSQELLDDYEPQGTRHYASYLSAFYFIFYMMALTYILYNLFGGLLITKFHESSLTTLDLDFNQESLLRFALTVKPLKHVPKFSCCPGINRWFQTLVNHSVFKVIVFILIGINTFVLILQHHEMDEEVKLAIYWINVTFTLLFAIETFLKLVAYTTPIYFGKTWRVFEFLIAAGSLLEFFLQLTVLKHGSYAFSHIASSFRSLRLLKLPRIYNILWTVTKTLELLPWIFALLAGVYIIYSLIGVQLFGAIEPVSIDLNEEFHITEFNNFGNFIQALLLLIRVSTGENWQNVMYSCTEYSSFLKCHNTTCSEQCGNNFAYIYFPSFFFLSAILVLNLFVAVISDKFDFFVEDHSQLNLLHLKKFVKLWSEHDEEGRGTLPYKELLKLFKRCEPPLGSGSCCPLAVQYKRLIKLNMPIVMDGDEERVSLNATLFALLRVSLNLGQRKECSIYENNKILAQQLHELYPLIMTQRKIDEVLPTSMTRNTVGQIYAAIYLQRQYILSQEKKQKRRRSSSESITLVEFRPDFQYSRMSDAEDTDNSSNTADAVSGQELSLESLSSPLSSSTPQMQLLRRNGPSGATYKVQVQVERGLLEQEQNRSMMEKDNSTQELEGVPEPEQDRSVEVELDESTLEPEQDRSSSRGTLEPEQDRGMLEQEQDH